MISNLKSDLKIVLHTDDYNETKLIGDYDVVGSSLSTAQSHSVSIFNRLYSRHNIFQPAFREQSIPKPCGADLKGQSGILLHMPFRNGVRRKMVASSNKNKDLLV